jgi:hypothetical protein
MQAMRTDFVVDRVGGVCFSIAGALPVEYRQGAYSA